MRRSVLSSLSWFHNVDRLSHPAAAGRGSGGAERSTDSTSSVPEELTMLEELEQSSSSESSSSSSSCVCYCSDDQQDGCRQCCHDQPRRTDTDSRWRKQGKKKAASKDEAGGEGPGQTLMRVLVNGKKENSLSTGSILDLLNYRQRKKKRSELLKRLRQRLAE